MGWQGVMRDAKGRRYWNMVPEIKRQGYVFDCAAVWRDDHIVWLFARSANRQELKIRMNRLTGEILI